SSKMRLSRKLIIEGIIFPLFLLYACNEPSKPASYVARVNGSYLTEEDVSELIDSQFVSEKSRSSIIKSWVRREVLYQEAVKQGITDTKSFKKNIENSKRELAAAILLEKFSNSSIQVYTNEDLENYYNENQTSFRLPFNSYFLNRVNFLDKNTAVQFRTEVISSDWKQAADKFAKDTSLLNMANEILLPEQDIYPSKLLRILEGLYPLEISIVISDDRGYYTVVQLLDKYFAQTIPPFNAVKREVRKRYLSALAELNVEDYINDLFTKNEIEINN
ncbi:MAG: peptidylprolyl isomerase, partial [Ignavibacteriaceae bacterium]|nr:peptidylprolyl isomerase [Ignavibacteriaceae bacterium]